MSKVLGWNLRYSEYKTSLDMVHGVFNSDDKFQNQSYNAWVAPRNQILSQYSGGATVSFFKALPSVLNQIMVQQYDGTEQTDQFLVDAGFNVQANSFATVLDAKTRSALANSQIKLNDEQIKAISENVKKTCAETKGLEFVNRLNDATVESQIRKIAADGVNASMQPFWNSFGAVADILKAVRGGR